MHDLVKKLEEMVQFSSHSKNKLESFTTVREIAYFLIEHDMYGLLIQVMDYDEASRYLEELEDEYARELEEGNSCDAAEGEEMIWLMQNDPAKEYGYLEDYDPEYEKRKFRDPYNFDS